MTDAAGLDTIRADLERECRTRLNRPHLKITRLEPIPEGHSGFTYFVTTEDRDGTNPRFVLRIPPPGARPSGPADVVRQGRIMAALHQARLPVPAIPAMSTDPVVDGRPFVFMEQVSGLRIEKTGTEQKPIDIATSAVKVLQRLHALKLDETGIGGEEPVGLRAEMMRWAWLMQRAPEELTTRAGEFGGMLAAKVPQERPQTLVHGDYHYGNMLFRGADVVAVLDWEIAQIGQPLLDLGCLCIVSHRRRYEGAPNPGGAIDVPMETLYELYGASPEDMHWYVAMSLYKYASIFGYNLMLHRRGKRPDPMYEGMTDTITGMIDDGIALLEQGA
jgi:aminoglycoside phosphotransferase (APT) family kinase protein